MNFYCMTIHKNNQATAGVKAPDDVSRIAKRMGAKEIVFKTPRTYGNLIVTRFFAMFVGIKNWIRLYTEAGDNALVLLQHPNENILVANKFITICKRRKKMKFIILIHDLESLRKSAVLKDGKSLEGRSNLADEVLMKKADYIICHNEIMKSYLIRRGFEEKIMVSLEIFDYLHECPLPDKRNKDESIVIAGNLMSNKCQYLYKLINGSNLGFKINLFGPNFEQSTTNREVIYHGQCSPEDLPKKLVGSFGLVWDGTEVDSCAGNMGEYIRYNNPHKCSLFLASNMPVIIWKEAALAKLIQSNNLGIVVDSLLDIRKEIESISEKEYEDIMKNVKKVGQKIRSGYYLQTSLDKIFEIDKKDYL